MNDPINWVDAGGLELISPEEGQKIVKAAEKWIGTPYEYGGKTSAGIDCSNFVHKASMEAGFPYEYLNTTKFPTSPRFKEVTRPQIGDVVLFQGHMGIYNPDAPSEGYVILSATTSKGVRYGRPAWFHGAPKYYRYDKPSEKAANSCP